MKTGILLTVVLFLLGTTLYVSYLLRQDSGSSPTTVVKTKAAARTATREVNINPPTPTSFAVPTATPFPTATPIPAVASADNAGPAALNASPTPAAAGATVGTPTPTSALLAAAGTPTPTEALIAAVSNTPTPLASGSATPTKTQELPDAGWIKPSHLMFLFAFSLIFFSLIY